MRRHVWGDALYNVHLTESILRNEISNSTISKTLNITRKLISPNMSATVNQDAAQSVSKQPGEFGSSRPPQPQQAKGHHQPGKIVPGSKDEIPESHVETMPAGKLC